MSPSKRRVCYVTGTRADFGLMVSTLRLIAQHPALELSVLVTGMHLAEEFGLTVREVEAEGFSIAARVPCQLSQPTGAQMARNIGQMLIGFVDALESARPDLLLVLGDRGEMLAGALAAAHLGIPVAHIHGGERSGTVDEPVRHAISKLAHLHFVATEQARDRLIRMGEQGQHVHVTGAPGLDGLQSLVGADRSQLCAAEGLDAGRALALFVYHPVLQEAAEAGEQARASLQVLLEQGYQIVALQPNSDAGCEPVRQALLALQQPGQMVVKTHLPRAQFVAWMACADVFVGNSSSGIIEAATFDTPVINLGSRQNMRERNANVTDIPVSAMALRAALQGVASPRPAPGLGTAQPNRATNVYGDGASGPRIARLLAELALTPELMAKCNAY